MIEVLNSDKLQSVDHAFQDPNRKNNHLVQLFGFYLPAAGMADTAKRIKLRFEGKNGLL